MSAVRAALGEQLSRWDDDAWAGLASRGLLRRARKDLESAPPRLVEEDEAVLQVQVGAEVVRLDARGPAHATCTCPSTGACQHLLTAGLWLAEELTTSDDAGTPLHDELMAVSRDALVRHAGTVGDRWARQHVADLDPDTVRVQSGHHVAISLPSPPVTFRYMGGGPDGLVPDTRLTSLPKHQAAAVLAYQRAHGVAVEPPPPRARRGGADGPAGGPTEDSRARLRSATAALLTDTVRLGLAHLSPAVHQRYETLAVWAQGADYPRLAQLLRRIADHVELQLDRSARADTALLLDETALAHALVHALGSSAAKGAAPTRLVGRARTSYDAVRSLELVGLGSVPWRAASGYRGLTTLFWWPAEARFVSLTDARPEGLRSFDPRARHTAAGPWSGLASPAAATGARVTLTGAQLSGAGRLSGVERTHAVVQPLDGPALAQALPAVDTWAGLGQAAPVSLLDLPDPLRDWVVLRPAGFGRPAFDHVSQELTWAVVDTVGSTLPLVAPYTEENAHLVALVEALGSGPGGGPEPGTLVVVRLRRGPAGVVAEPLSLVHPGRSAGDGPVEALHFAALPEGAADGRRRAPKQPGRAPAGSPADPAPPTSSTEDAAARSGDVPRELVDLRSSLLRRAERGTGATSPGVLRRELTDLHQRLRAVGLTVFPADLPEDVDPADLVLRTLHVARQVGALLGAPTTG